MSSHPNIDKLGIKISKDPIRVKWGDLNVVLEKHNIGYEFSKYYGIQTCYSDGGYVHDVEAVLERIKTGKRTGTQLFWD